MATNFCQRLGLAGGSIPALFDEFGRYSVAGLEGKITRPLLYPKKERVVRAVEGDEANCTINNPNFKHQIEFDWSDEVFKWERGRLVDACSTRAATLFHRRLRTSLPRSARAGLDRRGGR